MNKFLKNIIGITLVSVMAITGIFAFAAGGAVYAAEDQDSSASLQQGLDVELSGGDMAEPETAAEPELIPEEPAADIQSDEDITLNTAKLDSSGRIVAKAMTYSTTKLKDSDGEVIDVQNAGSYTVFKVIAKTSGKLYFYAEANPSNTDSVRISVGKFDSSTGQFTHSSETYLSAGGTDIGGGWDVTSGKTYYIGIYSYTYGQQAFVLPHIYSYKTRTLKAGKTMLASGYKGSSNKDSAVKFKIKPKKSGYIRVTITEKGMTTPAGYVTLLNSKKKSVSDKLWYYKGSSTSYVVFGVQKGKTYYLKATDCCGSYSNQYAYGIKYKAYSYSKRKNTSKKKAVTLKRKAKYKKTAVPANGKKGSQWYKFKVTKKRATQVTVNAKNLKSGTFKITVYCGKKKVGTGTISNGYVNKYKITNSTTYGKANRGTYYVKISKSKKANGAYQIKYAK